MDASFSPGHSPSFGKANKIKWKSDLGFSLPGSIFKEEIFGDVKKIWRFVVVSVYPGRIVLRIMYNQFYRVMSFNGFWKFEKLRNSAWYFLGAGGGGGVKILVEEFFWVLREALGISWVLIFVRIRSSLKLLVPLLGWVHTSPRWRAVRRSR